MSWDPTKESSFSFAQRTPGRETGRQHKPSLHQWWKHKPGITKLSNWYNPTFTPMQQPSILREKNRTSYWGESHLLSSAKSCHHTATASMSQGWLERSLCLCSCLSGWERSAFPSTDSWNAVLPMCSSPQIKSSLLSRIISHCPQTLFITYFPIGQQPELELLPSQIAPGSAVSISTNLAWGERRELNLKLNAPHRHPDSCGLFPGMPAKELFWPKDSGHLQPKLLSITEGDSSAQHHCVYL